MSEHFTPIEIELFFTQITHPSTLPFYTAIYSKCTTYFLLEEEKSEIAFTPQHTTVLHCAVMRSRKLTF